jgi:hypothetical protein
VFKSGVQHVEELLKRLQLISSGGTCLKGGVVMLVKKNSRTNEPQDRCVAIVNLFIVEAFYVKFACYRHSKSKGRLLLNPLFIREGNLQICSAATYGIFAPFHGV